MPLAATAQSVALGAELVATATHATKDLPPPKALNPTECALPTTAASIDPSVQFVQELYTAVHNLTQPMKLTILFADVDEESRFFYSGEKVTQEVVQLAFHALNPNAECAAPDSDFLGAGWTQRGFPSRSPLGYFVALMAPVDVLEYMNELSDDIPAGFQEVVEKTTSSLSIDQHELAKTAIVIFYMMMAAIVVWAIFVAAHQNLNNTLQEFLLHRDVDRGRTAVHLLGFAAVQRVYLKLLGLQIADTGVPGTTGDPKDKVYIGLAALVALQASEVLQVVTTSKKLQGALKAADPADAQATSAGTAGDNLKSASLVQLLAGPLNKFAEGKPAPTGTAGDGADGVPLDYSLLNDQQGFGNAGDVINLQAGAESKLNLGTGLTQSTQLPSGTTLPSGTEPLSE